MEHRAVRVRHITMTVHKIETELIDVSTPAGEQHIPGRTFVTAYGCGEYHSWPVREDERCWVGDTIVLSIIEDDPTTDETALLNPPPSDRRRRGGRPA
jgi:hypothetical protein